MRRSALGANSAFSAAPSLSVPVSAPLSAAPPTIGSPPSSNGQWFLYGQAQDSVGGNTGIVDLSTSSTNNGPINFDNTPQVVRARVTDLANGQWCDTGDNGAGEANHGQCGSGTDISGQSYPGGGWPDSVKVDLWLDGSTSSTESGPNTLLWGGTYGSVVNCPSGTNEGPAIAGGPLGNITGCYLGSQVNNAYEYTLSASGSYSLPSPTSLTGAQDLAGNPPIQEAAFNNPIVVALPLYAPPRPA